MAWPLQLKGHSSPTMHQINGGAAEYSSSRHISVCKEWSNSTDTLVTSSGMHAVTPSPLWVSYRVKKMLVSGAVA